MWLKEIDVPEPVLDAASAGKLVIFVGAGASRDQPAGLPDFRQLIDDVGTLAGHPPSEAEAKQPDVFLGHLEDLGVDVHQLVASAINQPASAPNRLHHAIVKLAAAHPSPRIVTTNYDLHLTTAAKNAGINLAVFEAPALPVGDDFEGIVHLHGALAQEARRLVVTDADFGRAYLRDAWAARFLERMFSTFTVLFIGYSHGDVVIQYLARSLGSSETRFVLTDDGDNAAWRRLGLTAIPYPASGTDHSALPDALERWIEIVSMGFAEHRARIADLLSAEPPTIPEEISYLEATLEDPERIKYFAEKADGPNWFRWVSTRPSFQRLLGRETPSNEASHTLMAWIADRYILDEEQSAIALRAFRDRQWSFDTWHTIAHRLFAQSGEFPEWLGPWLLLTLQNAPSRRSDFLDYMLANKNWSNNFDLALLLLEDRTQPHIKPAFDMGGDTAPPRFEVDLCGDEHWLTDAWTKVFLPALTEHLRPTISLVDQQIARAYQALRTLDASSTFDPISFHRSAVEPHSQDEHREAIDALIDAARDCIEAAISGDPDVADRHLASWSASEDAILKRLAVHGWRIRSDRSASEKLAWLRERDWLWEIALQHEVFQLLKEALPTADQTEARWLVDAATAGPPDDVETEISPYRSYNLLAWLADSAPGLSLTTEAFEAAQAAHPEYAPRAHPDLNKYMSSGFVEDAMPWSVDEFHTLIEQDPQSALARLREFKTENFGITGPSWTGALRSLQACVAANPEDGIAMAHAAVPDDAEPRIAIIQGWGRAELDEALVDRVVSVIEAWEPNEIRNATSKMISSGGGSEHPTRWHRFERARRLATRLWPTSPTQGAITSGDDLVMEAINHPAGDLAEFWIKVVQWEWSANQSTWQGLPPAIAEQLDVLVAASDRNGLLARTILSSQLHFFFGADRAWCQDHLLPLFDWGTDETNATAAWQGFLTWGRPNDGLLQAGLLDDYVESAKRSSGLAPDLQHQLAAHLASIAMHGSPEPSSWLTRFVIEAPDELRATWAERIARALTELEPGESTLQWSRWIQAYWSGRNQSTPRPFTPQEASATAEWVIGLPGIRSEAIDLVLVSQASLDEHGHLLYRIHDLELTPEATDWARLLTHVLKNTKGQHWGIGHYLKEIVPKLRAGTPTPDLSGLVNEAMRLGASDAPDW